ncbi:MAG: hypothetical protein O9272_10555 [Brevundimonas sp.]|nr:hypothetical protein [Brevundimonas sp.]
MPLSRILPATTLAMLLSAAAPLAAAKPCTPLPSMDAQTSHCAMSTRGLVIAGNAERAARLLELGDAAHARFAERFGREPARYAIVEIGTAGFAGAIRDDLRKQGFPVSLPWLSPEAYRDQALGSIRRGLQGRLAGLPEEMRATALRSAEEQVERQFSAEATASRDATAIPHELGHMWLIEAYWGNVSGSGGHYGGPGPDWLDEMAAVILEPDFSADRRRELFAQRYRAIMAGGTGDDLLNLQDYFGKIHPVGESARALVGSVSGDGGAQVRVLTGEEAQRIAGDGIKFYLQSRLVADYLIERTGQASIFGEVAGFVAKGNSFADWLARHGRGNKLPGSQADFITDWLEWLKRRYPPKG